MKIKRGISLCLITALIMKTGIDLHAFNYYKPSEPLIINAILPTTTNIIEQLMLRYSPYGWLGSNEKYKGLSFEAYLSHPETHVVVWPNHGKNGETKTIVIPHGQVTMEKLYCLSATPHACKYCTSVSLPKEFKNKFPVATDDLYLEGSECFNHGAHPSTVYATFADPTFIFYDEEDNVKKTPIYAFYSESETGLAYVQYYFFSGYNGAYGIHIPIPGLSYIPLVDVGNHKMDLEHLTLEFNKKEPCTSIEQYELRRIGFSAHNEGEMKWLQANDPDLRFIDNHPEVFFAEIGHGLYPPPPGTWLRIFGQANDVCTRGQLWKGTVVRLELPEHKDFIPLFMGITGFPGNLGPQSISGVAGGFVKKKYTGNPHYEDGGISKIEAKKTYCEEEDNWFSTQWRIGTQRFNSCYIPSDITAQIENGHVFAPNLLPPHAIRVKKYSTLIFKKKPDLSLELRHNNQEPWPKNYFVLTIKPQSFTKFLVSIIADPKPAAEVIETHDQFEITFSKIGIVQLTFFEEDQGTSPEKVMCETHVHVE